MSKLGLLSAGLSTVLGEEVVLQEGGATSISIHDVVKRTYKMKPPGFRPPSRNPERETTFPIFVICLCIVCFGSDTITLQVTERHSVFEMKRQIRRKVGIELEQFDLILHNKCLDDDRTVKDYGLEPESKVYLRCRLQGGGGPLIVSTDDLAPEFDCDFTDVKDDGKRYMRGGFEYKRPYGWHRIAMRVVERYENDDWLGPNGNRRSQARREWPVSYHGTDLRSAQKIVKEGYKPGPRARFGIGIYTSPSLEMVERLYAQKFSYDGKKYKIAFQNRVNPDQNGHLTIIPAKETEVGADYWLSPEDDDVRPYGILIREVRKTESQPVVQSSQTGAGADYWVSSSYDDVCIDGILIGEVLQTEWQPRVLYPAQSAQPSLEEETDDTCSCKCSLM